MEWYGIIEMTSEEEVPTLKPSLYDLVSAQAAAYERREELSSDRFASVAIVRISFLVNPDGTE